MIDLNFWETVVSKWISIQTKEDKIQVAKFAQQLIEKNSSEGLAEEESLEDAIFG